VTAASAAAPVAIGPVRRWIRRTRAAHRDGGETASTLYFAVFFAAVVGSIFYDRVRVVVWPADPGASALAGVALLLTGFALLYVALRRLGPVALSRPATSWLLTAPVDRRRLLLPALWRATVPAALAGALGLLVLAGHVAPRPVPGHAEILLPVIGALAGVATVLVATAAQAAGRLPDRTAYLLLTAGLAGLVADSVLAAPRAAGWWPPDATLLAVAGALALVVAAGLTAVVRGLAATPNDRLLEAAVTAGTVADSAYGVEPSFLTDMVERRYWSRRRLRSTRLWRRVPVLVAQDLLLVRRRPGRLLRLAAAMVLPAVFAHAPGWLLAAAVLAGAVAAGGTSAAAVRTDAGNPVLLRLLGISSRQAVAQRLAVPVLLAALWSAGALTVLWALGAVPGGPWWALGVALGPAGAVAAVRRARAGFVDNGLLPVDTPMGSISTGPVLNALIGVDVLVLGLPAVVQFVAGGPLTWTAVAVQAAVSALGVWAYLRLTTSPHRVELPAG
jgi:hypothetical protein